MADLLATLQDLMAQHLSNPLRGGGRLDHLWIYLDEPPVPDDPN
jgi:hypothetical protein